MTNFERIKSMSEKELAHFLTKGGCHYCCSELYDFCRSEDKSTECKAVVKKWLESEQLKFRGG